MNKNEAHQDVNEVGAFKNGPQDQNRYILSGPGTPWDSYDASPSLLLQRQYHTQWQRPREKKSGPRLQAIPGSDRKLRPEGPGLWTTTNAGSSLALGGQNCCLECAMLKCIRLCLKDVRQEFLCVPANQNIRILKSTYF